MKIKIPFIIAILLFLLSCNEQQEQTRLNSFAPKVVEAKGYIVPKDSMATPKIVLAGKPKVVLAGKPTVVLAKTNVHLAGIPKTVIAGTPKICTPGKDSFSLPKLVPAINRPFVAGIPEVVTAKDAGNKAQNSQNFSSFTKLEGLKNSAIICMIQDKNGNIWYGTWGGGATRYDGKNFTHFTEKAGLSNNTILSMLEDRGGNIWFGHREGGVTKYDGKNFAHYTQKDGLINNKVTYILEDRIGNLWFGTWGGGVSKYDGRNFTNYSEKQGLSNDTLECILEDKSGNIWFGTWGGGPSKFDGNNFTNYPDKGGLSNYNIRSILEDKSGNLWFGTQNGGVLKYDGKNFTRFTEKEGLSDNNVEQILEDKSGNIWFGTESGGISKYDGKNFMHFTENEGLVNNNVNCILEDSSGDLWFGTEGGVSKYNGNIFTHFTQNEGLNNNDVWSIFEDRSGNLWLGGGRGVLRFDGKNGGALKYDGKNFTHFTEKEGLMINDVRTILEDKFGNMWFSCFGCGVCKYDGKSFTYLSENEGLGNKYVTRIFQDKSGNLWFGSVGGGVSKYNYNTFTYYTKKEGLSDNDIEEIFEDKSGNIWFGHREGGLTKYDGKNFTHFTEKEGLSGKNVSGILEDRSGNIWISTDGGISEYDGKTFTYYTEKEGLSNNKVSSVFEDRSGNLWFGTDFGLNKLTPKSLLKLSTYPKIPADKDGISDLPHNDPASEVLFKSYSEEDGFLGMGCNLHSIFEDKNGIIWIGANDRLTAYHPEGDKINSIPPNIQLTNIALFNENIPWANLAQKKDTSIVLANGVSIYNFEFDSLSRWYNLPEHLSLPYNNNYLNFSFIGITTNSPKKVKYQYKLEGLDKIWSTLTLRSEAAYGNLPYGRYTFKVKAMNGGGYWSRELDYTFRIRPPWWKTWGAWSFYGLSLITALYFTHRFQRNRVLEKERKLSREREFEQAKEIEKAYYKLEQAHENLKTTQSQLIQSEKMASLGELTAGIAHEIQNPLNFVNNFSEVSNELITEMGDELERENIDEAKAIASDIKQNLEKINLHGKRADAIVKSMLQHSRSSSGQKEPADINALVEEYLRLSYHGFRAKEKTFNALLKTDFDQAVGKVNIISQDIGRVLLNLYNNAFYAVMEKNKQHPEVFEPLVSVSTKKQENKILISVKDNGNGIPQNVLDKIFQPFFTTKPTGQGTGLGLSMSYDIVKAHGGSISVESSTVGETIKNSGGTIFTIELPA